MVFFCFISKFLIKIPYIDYFIRFFCSVWKVSYKGARKFPASRKVCREGATAFPVTGKVTAECMKVSGFPESLPQGAGSFRKQ